MVVQCTAPAFGGSLPDEYTVAEIVKLMGCGVLQTWMKSKEGRVFLGLGRRLSLWQILNQCHRGVPGNAREPMTLRAKETSRRPRAAHVHAW